MKRLRTYLTEAEAAEKALAKELKKIENGIIEGVVLTKEDIDNHPDVPWACCRAINNQFKFAWAKKASAEDLEDFVRKYGGPVKKFYEDHGAAAFRKLCGRISNAQKKINEDVGWNFLLPGQYATKVYGDDEERENTALQRAFEKRYKYADFVEWAKSLKYDPSRKCVVCALKFKINDIDVVAGEEKASEYISVSSRVSSWSSNTVYTVTINDDKYEINIRKDLGSHRI